MDGVIRQLRERVRDEGWTAVMVAADYQGGFPSFIYTLGLYQVARTPDFIITGIPAELAYGIIKSLAVRARSGESFQDWQHLSEVANSPLVLRRIMDEFANQRCRMSEAVLGEIGPYLQVVWPDKSGLFPWDPGFDNHFDLALPRLWESFLPSVRQNTH